MRLIISATSPYARKTRIVAQEKALLNRIRFQTLSPLTDDAASKIPNPLGKVPCLVLADDTLVYDSPVICEYLDSLDETPQFYPTVPGLRLNALTAQALGDGILDAAFSMVMERNRTDAEQSSFWKARWRNAIVRSLDNMERDLDNRLNFDIGSLTYAVALAYLDFRLPEIGWRSGHGKLVRWAEAHFERQSFVDTAPPS